MTPLHEPQHIIIQEKVIISVFIVSVFIAVLIFVSNALNMLFLLLYLRYYRNKEYENKHDIAYQRCLCCFRWSKRTNCFQMLIQANKKTIKSLVGVSRPLKQMCVMISSLQDYQRQCRDLYPSSPSSHIYFQQFREETGLSLTIFLHHLQMKTPQLQY